MTIRSANPAHRVSSPVNATSGMELAVCGRVRGSACAVIATGADAGVVSITSATATSSPVGFTATTGTLFKISTGTAAVVSIGISRTGSFATFASSNARFLGYTNSWP